MSNPSPLTTVHKWLAIWPGPLRGSEARLRGTSDQRRTAKKRPTNSRRCDSALTATRAPIGKWLRGIVKPAALVVSLFVSAGLMAAAIGSPGYSWARWVSLMPLLLCIRILGPIQAMGCGALWGSSLFLFSVTAVDTPILPTWRSLLLLTAIPGAYGYAGGLMTRGFGFCAISLAVAWMGVEYALQPLALQQFGLTGFVQETEASGQYLHLVGSFLGYAWVSFFVAYVNAALLSALTHVCKAGAGSRLVKRAAGSVRRLFPHDVAVSLGYHLLRSLQARAPPAAVS